MVVMREDTGAAADPGVVAFARSLGRLSLAILAAACAVAIYAAIAGRGLHADGARYLVLMLVSESFNFAEPSRITAHFLAQAPMVLAMWLGLVDLDGARLNFCLSLELVPLVPLVLCYAVLAADRKHFFYFPLLHYLTGTLSAGASPIVESLVAAGYFWLLFYLILFALLRRWVLPAALLLALPLAVLHESIALLGVFLAAGAAWRGRRESGVRAAAFWLLAAICLGGALAQAAFIAMPRSQEQRDGVIEALFGFYWLYARGGGFNMPAIVGLLGVALLTLLPSRVRRSNGLYAERRGAWLAAATFAVIAVAGVAVAAAVPQTVTPWLHFAARHIPGLYAAGFASAVVVTLLRPSLCRLWIRPAAVAIPGVLAAGALGWHVVEAFHWASFTANVRGILAESRGIVPREAAAARLGARDRRIFLNMAWSWSMPDLSIVLAPGGRVSALIGRERPFPFAWSLTDPAQFPASRFFDISAYRAAIGAAPGPERRP